MSNPIYSDPEWMQKFLHNAAIYFENRPTDGEETACWANAYNAEKCIKIAAEITRLRAELATARRDGMEEAAKLVETHVYTVSNFEPQFRLTPDSRAKDDMHHTTIAAAIRAAAGEVKP